MTKLVSTGVKNTRKECYHTDPDCPYIADNYREITTEEIEWHDLRLCSYCDPEAKSDAHEPVKFQDREWLDKLQEAHNE